MGLRHADLIHARRRHDAARRAYDAALAHARLERSPARLAELARRADVLERLELELGAMQSAARALPRAA